MSGALTETSILAGSSGPSGYDIDNSLRFENGDSSYLSKTFSGSGNQRTFTISLWFKTTTDYGYFYKAWHTDDNQTSFEHQSTLYGQFIFGSRVSNSYVAQIKTAGKYRDPAAWYHVVLAIDTTQSTASNRAKIYINGVEEGVISTTFPLNHQMAYWQDSSKVQDIGISRATGGDGNLFMDGYIADYHYLDGVAQTAASFGETDEDTNQWKAKKYAGSYGTNGFFLEFKSSGALGTDTSGNGNTFASTNLAATDQMIDTPQNSTGGNFATLNSLNNRASQSSSLSEGNLKLTPNDGSNHPGTATIGGMQSGKWYMEYYINTVSGSSPVYLLSGVVEANANVQGSIHDGTSGMPISRYMNGLGQKGYTNRNVASYGSALAAGNVVAMAVDITNGAIYWAVNNTWIDSGDPTSGATKTGAAFTDILSAIPTHGWTMFLEAAFYSGNIMTANFGQDSSFAGAKTAQGNKDSNSNGDFYYTPPSGFLALCTDNLADPSIVLPGEYFNTVLYTGNDADRNITGVGFQPDITVIKADAAGYNWNWMDSLRGPTKSIKSNSTAAEITLPADTFQAFLSDGFELGADASNLEFNTDGQAYVSWNWKAGGVPTATNSAGAGNVPTTGSVKINGSNSGAALAGTIPATKLSANTTSGFSIVEYTGTGNIKTVAHGLSVAPELVMVKCLDTLNEWPVGSTEGSLDFTDYLAIDKNNAFRDDDRQWNDTDPTSSVFHLAHYDGTNNSGDSHIAYCFHSIEGYSKIGSYKGNGNANGTFIYTGFRPKYFWCKNVTQAEPWVLWDGVFEPYNKMTKKWSFNTNGEAYVGNTTTYAFDMLSNGVKMRSNYSAINNNNDNFLFMAFAESPFKTANAR